MFLALQTQWRIVVGAMSRPVYQGLDYASVSPALELMGITSDRRADVFECLRLMERVAVEARNKPDE